MASRRKEEFYEFGTSGQVLRVRKEGHMCFAQLAAIGGKG